VLTETDECFLSQFLGNVAIAAVQAEHLYERAVLAPTQAN
jgi:hypothetical protein